MSREPRAFTETGIYHIMFRGTNKSNLFFSKWDYIEFLTVLSKLKEKFEFEIYAYCLMENHVHLVIKEKELKNISVIMHGLLTKYARWFNIKYERTGVLLENRYKSKAVETDEYLMQLIRYIHQNPCKAGITECPGDYKWSSYSDYLTEEKTLTDTSFLLEIMSLNEYKKFHSEEGNDDFSLYDKSKSKDYELIAELKKHGIDPPEQLGYIAPQEFWKVVEKLEGKFSQRHIVRVTGVSRNRFRNN